MAYEDEFLVFITSATAGFLNRGSVPLFEKGIAEMPRGGAILEIGNCCGLSLNVLSFFARRHMRAEPLFSCDPWPFPRGLIQGTNIDKHEYRAFVMDTFRRSVTFFSREKLPHSMEMSGDVFFENWRAGTVGLDLFGRNVKLGGPLGFAHIDGWHEYDAVRSDFDNCDEHLMAGGMIVFDDSGDDLDWEGVKRVVAECLGSGRYEVVAKNPNYLVRKLR
jgi:hypothetical protein